MKPSEIVAAAAEAAVRAMRHPDNTRSDLSRAELQAMYDAQCEATDEYAKIANEAKKAKAPETLRIRVTELEGDLAAVNRRLAEANGAPTVATYNAAVAAKNSLDDCDHPDCAETREREGYSHCAGGHLARQVVRAILGTERLEKPGL